MTEQLEDAKDPSAGASANKEKMKEIFRQLSEFELDGNVEGLLCIGFYQDSDDTTALIGAIQGKSAQLSKALYKAMEDDANLAYLIKRAMLLSIVD